MAITRKLWHCPKCGHGFVTRNMWHSCVRVPLSAHFKGKPAERKKTYNAWIAAARACGKVTAYAQKSRITIMASVRFAGCTVQRDYISAGLWMKRRVAHPLLKKTQDFGTLGFVHTFRLEQPSDVDAKLRAWMKEAYR